MAGDSIENTAELSISVQNSNGQSVVVWLLIAAIAARELGERLGRKVRIVTGKRKGRLELEYYGVDDLNDLLEALKELPKRG